MCHRSEASFIMIANTCRSGPESRCADHSTRGPRPVPTGHTPRRPAPLSLRIGRPAAEPFPTSARNWILALRGRMSRERPTRWTSSRENVNLSWGREWTGNPARVSTAHDGDQCRGQCWSQQRSCDSRPNISRTSTERQPKQPVGRSVRRSGRRAVSVGRWSVGSVPVVPWAASTSHPECCHRPDGSTVAGLVCHDLSSGSG
jgi:hypothetical protein